MPHVEYLTAATEAGRRAIQEVIAHSYPEKGVRSTYRDDIGQVPNPWMMARAVDGVPVSYLQIDPDRRMDMPHGELRYAFLMDVATRQDRHREGHFRAIMEHAFSCLRTAGIPIVVTHGRYPLYRPFGFEVFSHHCGIFVTPQAIERTLGLPVSMDAKQFLTVSEHRALHQDLLLITEVRTETLADCAAALQAAAALARGQGKARILFEEPSAPSYGSRYPIRSSPETPFVALARTCGAEVRLQGANPEDGPIPDADWIKVLDAEAFVREAKKPALPCGIQMPRMRFCISTESGAVAIDNSGSELRIGTAQDTPVDCILRWPATALAQLVTGYRSAATLNIIHGGPLPSGQLPSPPARTAQAIELLDVLFPACWRFSRNESWVYVA